MVQAIQCPKCGGIAAYAAGRIVCKSCGNDTRGSEAKETSQDDKVPTWDVPLPPLAPPQSSSQFNAADALQGTANATVSFVQSCVDGIRGSRAVSQQIDFKCPHCQQRVIGPRPAENCTVGQKWDIVCPACQGPISLIALPDKFFPMKGCIKPPPFPTTDSSKVEVWSKDAITVGEVQEFIAGLPDRSLTRRFADGSEDQYSLESFRREVNSFKPAAFVFSANKHFILKEMRKQNGWLWLEYACAFAHLKSRLIASERRITAEKDAHQIVELLREVESHVEIGITRDEYARLLSARWLHVKDFADKHGNQFPIFVEAVKDAFQNYRTALDLWVQGAGTLPLQFAGGGFGVAGAAKGMAASIVLNSLVGAYNRSKQQTVDERRAAEWATGSKLVAVARSVLKTNDSQ